MTTVFPIAACIILAITYSVIFREALALPVWLWVQASVIASVATVGLPLFIWNRLHQIKKQEEERGN